MSTMPHHSCRFLGGPKDGQILEIADVSTEIPCSDGIYTRHGNTFTFRQPPAESKPETWRDRAIWEPIFQ
jgi:hypothetical protein